MARTFDLPTISRKNPLFDFDGLNEHRLVETLQRNKVAIDFEKNVETLCGSTDKFFNKFPAIELFYEGLRAKIENDSFAFNKVRNGFSREGIKFILIKSADSFPYESDNLDILIKPNKFGKVARILRNTGYVELPQVREKHKFLFRKAGAYDELPLHIHTRVEWEGVQFVDSLELWHRHSTAVANGGFFVPSPEDCILVTSAHLFFENHELKLADLFKIDSCINKHSVNWDYVFDHARRLHWSEALCLTLLLINQAYGSLYGRTLIPNDAFAKIKVFENRYDRLFLKIIRPLNNKDTPVKIPYVISVIFFLGRVLHDLDLSLVDRLKKIGLVAVDVLRIKLAPVREN